MSSKFKNDFIKGRIQALHEAQLRNDAASDPQQNTMTWEQFQINLENVGVQVKDLARGRRRGSQTTLTDGERDFLNPLYSKLNEDWDLLVTTSQPAEIDVWKRIVVDELLIQNSFMRRNAPRSLLDFIDTFTADFVDISQPLTDVFADLEEKYPENANLYKEIYLTYSKLRTPNNRQKLMSLQDRSSARGRENAWQYIAHMMHQITDVNDKELLSKFLQQLKNYKSKVDSMPKVQGSITEFVDDIDKDMGHVEGHIRKDDQGWVLGDDFQHFEESFSRAGVPDASMSIPVNFRPATVNEDDSPPPRRPKQPPHAPPPQQIMRLPTSAEQFTSERRQRLESERTGQGREKVKKVRKVVTHKCLDDDYQGWTHLAERAQCNRIKKAEVNPLFSKVYEGGGGEKRIVGYAHLPKGSTAAQKKLYKNDQIHELRNFNDSKNEYAKADRQIALQQALSKTNQYKMALDADEKSFNTKSKINKAVQKADREWAEDFKPVQAKATGKSNTKLELHGQNLFLKKDLTTNIPYSRILDINTADFPAPKNTRTRATGKYKTGVRASYYNARILKESFDNKNGGKASYYNERLKDL